MKLSLRQARIDVIAMQIGDKIEDVHEGVVLHEGMTFPDAVEATLRDLETLEVDDCEALVADAVRYLIVVRGLYDPLCLETGYWSAA